MVRIAQHHRDRFPSAQFLDRIDIDPGLDEPRGKGMPEIMEPESRDSRLPHRRIERPQQIARIPLVVRAVDEDEGRAGGSHRGARGLKTAIAVSFTGNVSRAPFFCSRIVSVRRGQIHVGPVQLQDFSPSHPRVEREHDDLLEPGWRGGE